MKTQATLRRRWQLTLGHLFAFMAIDAMAAVAFPFTIRHDSIPCTVAAAFLILGAAIGNVISGWRGATLGLIFGAVLFLVLLPVAMVAIHFYFHVIGEEMMPAQN